MLYSSRLHALVANAILAFAEHIGSFGTLMYVIKVDGVTMHCVCKKMPAKGCLM